MTNTDRQKEIDAIEEAFVKRVSVIFAAMCDQLTEAGPGRFYADMKAARRARDVALAFANQPPTEN